jgi:general stress protein 26
MDPFLPEDDWSIWMGTNRESRKVRDIEQDPRVTLYYYSPEHAGYVAVYGTARLVDEEEERLTRWKEEWAGFYTDREAQYLLIQVVPERLEVINYSRGIGGDSETWEPPTVEFPGG